MASTYSAFLQSPSASMLAAESSIVYVTTTTSVNEPAAIIKHLTAQQKQVDKKGEKVLSIVEGADGLCLETETTLHFKLGGGAYLPGMDENLLDERIVTFPLLHIVRFDVDGKIKQVRLYWDQGTLLKQVEAIGRTGRNWPIRDGQAMVDAVSKSVRLGGPPAAPAGGPRGQHEVVANQTKKHEHQSVTRDPHASLALFERRDPNEEAGSTYAGPNTAPRSSAKPAPREYGDLFAGEDVGVAPARATSPSKGAKHGAGKNFSKNRLFDENELVDQPKSPERKKTYGQKYEHFAFGDGEDATQESRPVTGRSGQSSNKSQPNFSFEDFATPPKHTQKDRPSDTRHWGAGVDEDEPPNSPPKRPIVHAARPDAVSHFQLTDNSPAAADGIKPKKAATATNVDAKRQDEKFGAHYGLTDNSPADGKTKRGTAPRGDLDQQWSWGTHTEPIKEQKIYKTHGNGMGGLATRHFLEETPPQKEKKIYKTAGDGMGGRNNGGRSWGFGDDSDPEVDANVRPSTRSRRNQAEAGASGY